MTTCTHEQLHPNVLNRGHLHFVSRDITREVTIPSFVRKAQVKVKSQDQFAEFSFTAVRGWPHLLHGRIPSSNLSYHWTLLAKQDAGLMDLQQLICLKQLFGGYAYFGFENCLHQIVVYSLCREKASVSEGHREQHYNHKNNSNVTVADLPIIDIIKVRTLEYKPEIMNMKYTLTFDPQRCKPKTWNINPQTNQELTHTRWTWYML